ncbi:hypothetical protein TGPRC2_258420 [Toxoplasma gondii TgCatPRC2]|uniref:Uncharacterized protein n=1 Tax=Toxoplasma gondii TgCatPRC2 TaxID=1130821 RepID=A0A151HLP3_TOXGO|nr:hypothetical protein TGPRC2_258420 [Toxoplasma gondii TgCatPRC2]
MNGDVSRPAESRGYLSDTACVVPSMPVETADDSAFFSGDQENTEPTAAKRLEPKCGLNGNEMLQSFSSSKSGQLNGSQADHPEKTSHSLASLTSVRMSSAKGCSSHKFPVKKDFVERRKPSGVSPPNFSGVRRGPSQLSVAAATDSIPINDSPSSALAHQRDLSLHCVERQAGAQRQEGITQPVPRNQNLSPSSLSLSSSSLRRIMPASPTQNPSPAVPEASDGVPSSCQNGQVLRRDLLPPSEYCSESAGAPQNEIGGEKKIRFHANQLACQTCLSKRTTDGTPARCARSSFPGDTEPDTTPQTFSSNTPSGKPGVHRRGDINSTFSLESNAVSSSVDTRGNEGHKPCQKTPNPSSTSSFARSSSPPQPVGTGNTVTESWPSSAGECALLLDDDEDVVMLKGGESSWTKEKRDELMARVSHARLRQLRDLFLDPCRKEAHPWTTEEIELLQADYNQNHEDWVEVLQPWQATPLHLQAVPFTYSVLKKAPLKFPAIFCKQIPFFFPHPSGIGVFRTVLIIERRPREKDTLSRSRTPAHIAGQSHADSASAHQSPVPRGDTEKKEWESGNSSSPASCRSRRRPRGSSAWVSVSPEASPKGRAQGTPTCGGSPPDVNHKCSKESKARRFTARFSLSREDQDRMCCQNSGESLTEDAARLVLIWEPYQQTDKGLPTVSDGSEETRCAAATPSVGTEFSPSPCSSSTPIPALELPDDGLQPGAFAHVVTGRLSLPVFSPLPCARGDPESASESVSSLSDLASDHCVSPFAFTAVQRAEAGEGGLSPCATPTQLQRQEKKRILRMQRLQHKLLQGLEEADLPELVFEGRVVGCELHGFLPFNERRSEQEKHRANAGDNRAKGEAGPLVSNRNNGSEVPTKYRKISRDEHYTGDHAAATGKERIREAPSQPLTMDERQEKDAITRDERETRKGKEEDEVETSSVERMQTFLNREEGGDTHREEERIPTEGGREARNAEPCNGGVAPGVSSENRWGGKGERLGLRQRMLLCVRLEDDRVFLYEIRSFINHSAKALVDWERRVRVAEREIAVAAGVPLPAPSSASKSKLDPRKHSPHQRGFSSTPAPHAVSCLPGSAAAVALSGASVKERLAGADERQRRGRRAGSLSASRIASSETQARAAEGKPGETEGKCCAASSPASQSSLTQDAATTPVETLSPLEKGDASEKSNDSVSPTAKTLAEAPEDDFSREAVASEQAPFSEEGSVSDPGATLSAPAPTTEGVSLTAVPLSVPPSQASLPFLSRPDVEVPASDMNTGSDSQKRSSPEENEFGCERGIDTRSVAPKQREVQRPADIERAEACPGESEKSKIGNELQVPSTSCGQENRASPHESLKSYTSSCSSPSPSSSSSLLPSSPSSACPDSSLSNSAGGNKEAVRPRRRATADANASECLESPAEKTGPRRREEVEAIGKKPATTFKQTPPKRRLTLEEADDPPLWFDCDESPTTRRNPFDPSRRGAPRGGTSGFGKMFALPPLAVFHDLQWDASETRRLRDSCHLSQNVFLPACDPARAGNQDATSPAALGPDLNGSNSTSETRDSSCKKRTDGFHDIEKGAALVSQDWQKQIIPSAALCFFFSIYEEVEECDEACGLSQEKTDVKPTLCVTRGVQGGEGSQTIPPTRRRSATSEDNPSKTFCLPTNVKDEVPAYEKLFERKGRTQDSLSPAHVHAPRGETMVMNATESRGTGVGAAAAGSVAPRKTAEEVASGIARGETRGQAEGMKRRKKIVMLSHLAAVARAPRGFLQTTAGSGFASGDQESSAAGRPDEVFRSSDTSHLTNGIREAPAVAGASESSQSNVCSSRKSEPSQLLSAKSNPPFKSDILSTETVSSLGSASPPSAVGGKVCVWRLEPLLRQLPLEADSDSGVSLAPDISSFRLASFPSAQQKRRRVATEGPCGRNSAGSHRSRHQERLSFSATDQAAEREDLPLCCSDATPCRLSKDEFDACEESGKISFPPPSSHNSLLLCECYFPPNCIPTDVSATPGKTHVVLKRRTKAFGRSDAIEEKLEAKGMESSVRRIEQLPTMVTVDTTGSLRAWTLGERATCVAAQRLLDSPLLAVSINQQLPSLAAVGAGDGRVRICDISAFLSHWRSPFVCEARLLQPLASPLLTLPSPLGEDLYRVFRRQHPVRRLQWLAGGALLGVVHEQPASERHLAAFGSCAAVWAPGRDVFDDINDAAHHKLFWARAAKHPQAAKFARLVSVHVAHAVAALDRSEGAKSSEFHVPKGTVGSFRGLCKEGSARMLGCDFLFTKKGGVAGVSTDTASMLHFWKPGSWLLGDVEDIGVLARKTADKTQLSRALQHIATQIQLRSHVSTRAEKAKMQRQAEIASEDVERATHGESLACTREALMRPWQKFLAVRPVTRVLVENLRAEIQDEAAAFDFFADPHIQWLETK